MDWCRLRVQKQQVMRGRCLRAVRDDERQSGFLSDMIAFEVSCATPAITTSRCPAESGLPQILVSTSMMLRGAHAQPCNCSMRWMGRMLRADDWSYVVYTSQTESNAEDEDSKPEEPVSSKPTTSNQSSDDVIQSAVRCQSPACCVGICICL